MTILDKLQAKGSKSALVLNAPMEAAEYLAELGSAMKVAKTPGKGPYDLIFAFIQDSVQLAATLEKARVLMIDAARLWLAYPKKTSKRYQSDLDRDTGWETMKTLGYSLERQIGLDDDWSAIRFKHNTAQD